MKKLTLALAALFTLSFFFASCMFVDDNTMYELTEEDISSDWLDKTKWTGKKTVTITGDTPDFGFDTAGEFDIDRKKYSATELKYIIKCDGQEIKVLTVTYMQKNTVKSNRRHTKLWIEEIQEFNSSVYNGTITTITELEKD